MCSKLIFKSKNIIAKVPLPPYIGSIIHVRNLKVYEIYDKIIFDFQLT